MTLTEITKASTVAKHGQVCPTCQDRHLTISVTVRVDYGGKLVHVELCPQIPTHTLYASGSGYIGAAGATAGTIAALVQKAEDAASPSEGVDE